MKIIFTLLVILLSMGTFAQSRQMDEQITVDGISRKFVTYIPSVTNADYKMPVIISLHGRLGTGRNMMGFADFRPIADREKFMIVCPDGIDRSWNDGRGTPAARKGINDVKFISHLITYIIDTYHADSTRVYVTGMSNGGFMASRVACELPKKIAAAAVVAASMDEGVDYSPLAPMPIMYIQGTADPLVPYSGGVMSKGAGGEIYSHHDILKKWAVANGCGDTPVITALPDTAHDGTSVNKEEYSNPNRLKVIGYSVINGGHTWPGGSQYLPKFIIGKATHGINACQVIWDFFKGYVVSE